MPDLIPPRLLSAVLIVFSVSIAIAQPSPGKTSDTSAEGQSKADAREIASVSASLSGIGVAHVFPKGMGGVEATIRLLREAVATSEKDLNEKIHRIVALSDEQARQAAEHLKIISVADDFRLVYIGD